MKKLICAAAFCASVTFSHADMLVGPWVPIFQGIDHVVATNCPPTTVTNNGLVFTDTSLQVVHCLRIDLSDPGVRLFTTPRASGYVPESRETLSLGIPSFVRNYGAQVAADCNFYSANPGGSDPSSEGLPCNVFGLLASTGTVVSVPDGNNRYASLLFDSNKVATINLNTVPGTDTNGIYTAVTGFYPVLTNGINVWALYYADLLAAYPDPRIHTYQPRTAFGLSQDKRYLYMMTIDGRQPSQNGGGSCGIGQYSNGALDAETGLWLLQFGAWDGINMDGGGSTAMYMADCVGNPVPLNHSSLLAGIGRERYIGDHFGVYAQPLPAYVSGVTAAPAITTATITWTTVSNSTSQVNYGLTTSYGTFSPLDSTPVTNHSVTLTGLNAATRYYFRVLSSDGTTVYTSVCGGASLVTTNDPSSSGTLYTLTNNWKYSAANLDGVNWQALGYDDSAWTGPTTGVLFISTSPTAPNGDPSIQYLPLNKTQQLPVNPSTTYPFITYYFRTHFNFSNSVSGATLTFSNFYDDGLVFYLNGTMLTNRFVNLPATNASLATANPCSPANANCSNVMTFAGPIVATNLHVGDNVVAAEVHNFAPNSVDVTFGQALFFTAPPLATPPPFLNNLVATPGENSATITWTTRSNATSKVFYGLTPSLGSSTPLDATPVTNHSVTLTNLLPLTNYYVQAVSSFGGVQYTGSTVFATVPFSVALVSMTNIWAYQTNNLDGANWAAPTYDESLFPGIGPALLYIETNQAVAPRNTPLPPMPNGLPFNNYYFRTHFVFNTNLAGLALVFSNYIDDGAVFYLNGKEIQRVRMAPAPQPVLYSDFATDCPNPPDCEAATNAPDMFRISGDLMTNLVHGADNVLAAEVHQRNTTSPDIVFGSSMSLVRALVSETRLRISRSGNMATISWDGVGFTLQQNSSLGAGNWGDVPGPVKASPYVVTNPPSTFYRLRN